MDLMLRIKTGFFETTTFRLEIGEKELQLVPIKPEETAEIVLEKDNIHSVTLREKRLAELGIQTRNMLYWGIFEKDIPFEQVVSYFRENLNIPILCEYEGRNTYEKTSL
ncbi:MAG: hypothetical protein PHU31_07820 [Anaerotignum sp.]|nr:hypothetical protein [Anaerotignum sp.]